MSASSGKLRIARISSALVISDSFTLGLRELGQVVPQVLRGKSGSLAFPFPRGSGNPPSNSFVWGRCNGLNKPSPPQIVDWRRKAKLHEGKGVVAGFAWLFVFQADSVARSSASRVAFSNVALTVATTLYEP